MHFVIQSNLRLFINGAKVSVPVSAVTITYDTSPVRIGSHSSAYPQRFNGLIDDVRLYNTAIPISQIKEQYYLGLNNLLNSRGITKEEYLSRVNSIAQQ
ncbi:MAG: LamG-like jellyroll fold domain-containing protein [Candidatus Paceibacterota bacterium]